MPTENPKISLYVPQQVYDRFKEFQEEQKLSMSQAGIVILAEYFGLKDVVTETTSKLPVGGVTLQEFQEFKELVLQINERLSLLETNSEPPEPKQELEAPGQTSLFDVASEPKVEFSSLPVFDRDALAERLDIVPGTLANNSRKSNFPQWSKKKDPDGISWIAAKTESGYRYSPDSNTPSELLSGLNG